MIIDHHHPYRPVTGTHHTRTGGVRAWIAVTSPVRGHVSTVTPAFATIVHRAIANLRSEVVDRRSACDAGLNATVVGTGVTIQRER